MGNHCGSSLKKKDKSKTDSNNDGEVVGDDQRRPSTRSADSVPYGVCAAASTSDSSGQPFNSAGASKFSAESQSDNQHHLTVSRLDTSDASPSGGSLAETCQNTLTSYPNPPTSPAPSSCSPAPPAAQCFDALYTLPEVTDHVIAISSGLNQLRVLRITGEEAESVRTLNNINQPRHLQLLDSYNALVLCNRELMVFNLDEGKLVCKVKGVMNQKMPFFGLHSNQYAVALSRNRMYVNLLSLTTGNLETTFKVGEDRFLNSLLVSSNGRICVCGDETQKPFPLLVWDLSSRKLIYDLRIPHHEFITRIAAISHDGHFVVSACRETTSSASNFIVVYDLQSGTLFKKWKPDCNTVSIAISSKDSCVMNGLENNQIQVWDLSTGAIRFTLEGHISPVDKLLVADCGQYLVSYDSNGKDQSIRVWNINDGSCVKVYCPDYSVSCCLLSATSSHLLICPKDSNKVNLIKLDVAEAPTLSVYGNPDNEGIEIDIVKD